ncbi:MAG TPA: LLM class flavin-dependent oxidoreductase [Pyrinomonadaceae bacterium]|jgi:natural product biosynthesis luciferase-like monooxygenase protein
MDDLSKRFDSLTPEQRALLELRLKQQGLAASVAQASAVTEIEETEASAREDNHVENADWKAKSVEKALRFSLYFFSDDGSRASDEKYRLVLESAKYADEHGFSAVWTPERHFQDFGGLYPNPSVLSAALAVLTRRVQIRAGSVALPLHHPVRVAEEWSVVDNLSKGRAAVSFASGWHPDDFIFAPENYEERKAVMYRHIELVQRLWAGETVELPGVDGNVVAVKVLPRPVQPRLPMWVTSAGNPETWTRAGEIGANVLAALIGYSFEDLRERINNYRKARERAGHDPHTGIVSMMLHTFVGDSNAVVKEKVRVPFTHYLGTYFKQYENVRLDAESVTAADREAIAAAAFEHYFDNLTLMGTPAKCSRVIEPMIAAGVNEVACLVDFGVEHEAVLESLHHLNELREHYDKAN